MGMLTREHLRGQPAAYTVLNAGKIWSQIAIMPFIKFINNTDSHALTEC